MESALLRDMIELHARPAATSDDLLGGLKFSVHVVHFSGHRDVDLIEFEEDHGAHREGLIVSARLFARAMQSPDEPAWLVLLKSCNSASQIDELMEPVVPFAIGMADEFGDDDAINYAAGFYVAIANGQSVQAAHNIAEVRLEMAGPEGAKFAQLAFALKGIQLPPNWANQSPEILTCT